MKRMISILLLIVMVGHSSIGLLKLAESSTEMVAELDLKKEKDSKEGKESKEFMAVQPAKPDPFFLPSHLFPAEQSLLAPSPVLHRPSPPPDCSL